MDNINHDYKILKATFDVLKQNVDTAVASAKRDEEKKQEKKKKKFKKLMKRELRAWTFKDTKVLVKWIKISFGIQQ